MAREREGLIHDIPKLLKRYSDAKNENRSLVRVAMLCELGSRAKFVLRRNGAGGWFGFRWAELNSRCSDSAGGNRDSSCWDRNSSSRTSGSWRGHCHSTRWYSDTSRWPSDSRNRYTRNDDTPGIDSTDSRLHATERNTEHEYAGQHASGANSASELKSAHWIAGVS